MEDKNNKEGEKKETIKYGDTYSQFEGTTKYMAHT